jgi:hypothetical protein
VALGPVLDGDGRWSAAIATEISSIWNSQFQQTYQSHYLIQLIRNHLDLDSHSKMSPE